MTKPTPQDPLDREDALWRRALELVLALNAAPADDRQRRAVADWRDADPAHEAALREAERVWRLAGQVEPSYATRWRKLHRPSAGSSLLSRRRLLTGTAALAAALAAVAFMTPLRHRLQGAETTGAGETRIIALPDGSLVTLGPDSAAVVDYAGPGRRVELIDGIAFFDVTRDAARPFEVEAHNIIVRVLGTAFEVKRIGGKIMIAVTEGAVEVNDSVTGASFGSNLQAGDWMTIDQETHALETGHAKADAVAAWRDGFLVVENRQISELVEEIGRWHVGAIFITDDGLGRRRVSGVLDLRDPESALKAILALYGGRVDRMTPWVLFISADS